MEQENERGELHAHLEAAPWLSRKGRTWLPRIAQNFLRQD